jgi:hypothetical protein
MSKSGHNVSTRVYALLLFAYPPEFRRMFGSEMVRVFRDCYRDQDRSRVRLWGQTLVDLVVSVFRERYDEPRNGGLFMNNLRRDLIGLAGCVGIIAIAGFLLGYGRKHEVTPILSLGYVLDALVTTGVIGNLIVFILLKLRKLDPVRTAAWVFGIVHAIPLGLILLLARNDPKFSLGNIVIGYFVSFLFWFGLHWMWNRTVSQRTLPEQ